MVEPTPFEKYARQIGFIFPNFRGEHKKSLKNPPPRNASRIKSSSWVDFWKILKDALWYTQSLKQPKKKLGIWRSKSLQTTLKRCICTLILSRSGKSIYFLEKKINSMSCDWHKDWIQVYKGIKKQPDGNDKNLHPWKLAWNLKIIPLKRKLIFNTIIFGFRLSFQGCTNTCNSWEPPKRYIVTNLWPPNLQHPKGWLVIKTQGKR